MRIPNLSKEYVRLVAVWPLVGLVLLCMLWSGTFLQLRSERMAAEQRALAHAASLSSSYARFLLRAMQQMEQATLQLKHDWEGARGTLRLEELKKIGLYVAPQFALAAIYDQDGRPRTATAPLAQLARGDAAGYGRTRGPGDAGAMQIRLAAGQGGRPLINFSRRLENADGSFAGVALIAVDPAYFSEFYDAATLGRQGLVAMLGRDGGLYSAGVGGKPAAPRDGAPALFGDTAFLAAQRGAVLAPARPQSADGGARFLAWQPLAGYRFTAVIGLAQADVLQPYVEARATYIGIAGAVSCLLCAFVAILTGVSVRMARRHRQSEGVRAAYRMATESTSDGFYIVAAIRDAAGEIVDFQVVDCNERGAEFFSVQREQLLGLRMKDSPEAYFRDLVEVYKQAMASGFGEQELELPPGNAMRLSWIRRRLVRSGEQLAITVTDIGMAKAHERDLLRLANEDALTGLHNRHWLAHFLPEAIARAAAAGSRLALLHVDLDAFKGINDTGGLAEGDRVLRAVSLRLGAVLAGGGHLARLGGDEFVVLLEPLRSDAMAQRVAEHIAESFEEPFANGEVPHRIGVSVGISLYPSDGEDMETLLKNADIAMSAVKMAGKGHHRFYTPELYEVIRSRREIEQHLVEAFALDQFIVYYQPRVDTRSGALCSMEALVRWQHPSRGLVPPLEFIPVAESSGLISQLGEVVIDKVCRQLALWQAEGVALLPVSINVSAHQFGRGDLHLVLAAAMQRHGIAGRYIEVEITESAMMGEHGAIVGQLAAIRAQGVKLLVDDFGTGYSSLSQLQTFAMDGLKIDRAFTSELGKSEQGEIFVRAILSMAHALGMSVVAEGVETLEQARILSALSCNELQGYYISRPVAAEQMLDMMRKNLLVATQQVELVLP